MSSEFPMTYLGPLPFFLGIAAFRIKDVIFLSQSAFAREILSRVDMLSCKPSNTLIDTDPKLSPYGTLVADPSLHRSLVGALQYLTFTRSDILYVVQQIRLFMYEPREPYFLAPNRIFHYNTRNTFAWPTYAFIFFLVAYSNANWVGCPQTRWPTSGFCVYLGDSLVSLSSNRQHDVYHSLDEA